MAASLKSLLRTAIKTGGVPTGTIITFAGKTIPDGYLLCNGQAVSRTTYSDLFSILGTLYGAGDGSTTFNLPNLQHRFPEFTTSLEEVGSYVEAGLPDISGYINWMPSSGSEASGGGALGFATPSTTRAMATKVVDDIDSVPADPNIFASRSNSVYGRSSTVQPDSIRVLPCIRS